MGRPRWLLGLPLGFPHRAPAGRFGLLLSVHLVFVLQAFFLPAPAAAFAGPDGGADLGGALVGFRADGDGSGFFLTGAVTDGLSASLDIPHFSAAGFGRIDDRFSAFCPFELLQASLPAANLARVRLLFLTHALIAGCVDDDPLVAGQIVADIFEEWYLQTVLPATQGAAEDPEASIQRALGTANEWLAALNTDPLAQELQAQDRLRLPFACPEGSCIFLKEAAVQTAESLLESLRLAVARADSRCQAEGLNDDRATLEWIDLGNVLVGKGRAQRRAAASAPIAWFRSWAVAAWGWSIWPSVRTGRSSKRWRSRCCRRRPRRRRCESASCSSAGSWRGWNIPESPVSWTAA